MKNYGLGIKLLVYSVALMWYSCGVHMTLNRLLLISRVCLIQQYDGEGSFESKYNLRVYVSYFGYFRLLLSLFRYMNEVVGEAFAWRQDERGKIEMT